MKTKNLNRNIILIISTLLLIVSLILFLTMGWFSNNKIVKVNDITASVPVYNFTTDGVFDDSVTVTADALNYVTRDSYENGGLAPACLAYYTFTLSAKDSDFDVSFNIKVDYDNFVNMSKSLQFYKGDFTDQLSIIELPDNGYSMWQNGKYATVNDPDICNFGDYRIAKGEEITFTVAFFWPYTSGNNAGDTQITRNFMNGAPTSISLDINGFAIRD